MTSRAIQFLVLSLVLNCLVQSAADAQTTAGKSFWLCFPQNARYEIGQLNHRILVVAMEEADVAITVPKASPGPTIGKKLLKGESYTFDLDTSLQCLNSEVVQNNGVHVGSTGLITVIASTVRKASGDSYRVMPVDALGGRYMVIGYDAPAADPTFTTNFTVVATQDNTTLDIELSALTKLLKKSGENISVTLDRGQTYTVKGGYQQQGSGDLTGTVVTAKKPVAVFTGHSCAQVPYDVNFCDVLVEMSAPLERAGREFVVPMMQKKGAFSVRILATEDETNVKLSSGLTFILNEGKFRTIDDVSLDLRIVSNKPVIVAQYATSFDADSIKVGDPFMAMIPPIEAYTASSTFATQSVTGDWEHYVTIICDRDAANSLTLNGKRFGSASATSFDDDRFVIFRTNLTAGVKQLDSDGKIAVFSYGFGAGKDNFDSYGTYCGPW
jgi:adhesin/invasin